MSIPNMGILSALLSTPQFVLDLSCSLISVGFPEENVLSKAHGVLLLMHYLFISMCSWQTNFFFFSSFLHFLLLCTIYDGKWKSPNNCSTFKHLHFASKTQGKLKMRQRKIGIKFKYSTWQCLETFLCWQKEGQIASLAKQESFSRI